MYKELQAIVYWRNVTRSLAITERPRVVIRAVFDEGRGSGGFDPPQEVADPPPESSAEPLWGVDSNPLRTPRFHFLLNQYIYVGLQLYAAYASIETDVI